MSQPCRMAPEDVTPAAPRCTNGDRPSLSGAASGVPSDAELSAYVRRNLLKTGAILLAIVLVLGFVGLYFEEQLLGATSWLFDRLGLLGIAVVLFISDAFCAPIPSDFAILVIAKSHLNEQWYLVVPGLALWSSFSGGVAWFLGTKLGRTRWGQRWFGRLQTSRHHAYAARLGKWGVAIGATTPVPYSLTCWVAGTLELKLGEFFWVNLLRIPRFLIYYAAFAHSDALLRWLF